MRGSSLASNPTANSSHKKRLPSQSCLENSSKAHFCPLSHCLPCLPKAKSNFPILAALLHMMSFFKCSAACYGLGTVQAGFGIYYTTTYGEHCLKAPGIPSALCHQALCRGWVPCQKPHPSTTCCAPWWQLAGHQVPKGGKWPAVFMHTTRGDRQLCPGCSNTMGTWPKSWDGHIAFWKHCHFAVIDQASVNSSVP